ncbi:MAG: rhomboid family intramembrane serine protease [Nitratireductor sp.]|nr:rhomboid family intramembrane serine protease [Nitratireductor sp.]
MFIPLHDANTLKYIRLQYVTLAIIALNVLVWLITGSQAASDPQVQQASFYAYGFIPSVVNGIEVLPVELDRIPPAASYITYAFFHGDFMHLAGNMLFIWVFGDNVEDAMGHLRFIFFYLACAAAAAFAHALPDPQSSVPLIGASGAAAGIVAAYLLLHPKVRIWVLALGRIPLRIPALYVLGGWAAFQVFQFLTDTESQVSWMAHIGGMIAGGVLIVFLHRKGVELFDRQKADAGDGAMPAAAGDPPAEEVAASIDAPGKRGPTRWGRDAGR